MYVQMAARVRRKKAIDALHHRYNSTSNCSPVQGSPQIGVVLFS